MYGSQAAPFNSQQWIPQTPHPMISLDGMDGSTQTMARGSAAVQDIVNLVEHNPLAIIQNFEMVIARETGAVMPWQTWSTSEHARLTMSRVQGHVTLKKMLTILAHTYELHRRYPQQPEYARAFTAQALKVVTDVCRSNGSWELSWPLLGLPDPDSEGSQLLSPAERVAVAALAKEKKVLQEIATAAKKKGGDS